MNIPLLNQSPATYFTYRDENRVFEDIGLWNTGHVSVTGVGEPERVAGLDVTDGHAARPPGAAVPRAAVHESRRFARRAGPGRC